MTSGTPRPYHHGDLERAAIDGAVEEVRTVGVAAVSMRRIARRAGVSHAALAYQFGDKAGIFTAIATEGFRLAAAAIGPAADDPHGMLFGGQAYVRFALAHPGHFEVMFRPYLYRADDPKLVDARDAAFGILYSAARASLSARAGGEVTDGEVTSLVVAGWSMAHGLATLALTQNLPSPLNSDAAALDAHVAQGAVLLGGVAQRLLDGFTAS